MFSCELAQLSELFEFLLAGDFSEPIDILVGKDTVASIIALYIRRNAFTDISYNCIA